MDADGRFGEGVAATYDEYRDPMFSPEVIDPTVDFLARLAGDGKALEFAIGTGRIALPLKERGVEVHGHRHVAGDGHPPASQARRIGHAGRHR